LLVFERPNIGGLGGRGWLVKEVGAGEVEKLDEAVEESIGMGGSVSERFGMESGWRGEGARLEEEEKEDVIGMEGREELKLPLVRRRFAGGSGDDGEVRGRMEIVGRRDC
jgi:hypothetical protein